MKPIASKNHPATLRVRHHGPFQMRGPPKPAAWPNCVEIPKATAPKNEVSSPITFTGNVPSSQIHRALVAMGMPGSRGGTLSSRGPDPCLTAPHLKSMPAVRVPAASEVTPTMRSHWGPDRPPPARLLSVSWVSGEGHRRQDSFPKHRSPVHSDHRAGRSLVPSWVANRRLGVPKPRSPQRLFRGPSETV